MIGRVRRLVVPAALACAVAAPSAQGAALPFASPPNDNRPGVRWWWLTPYDLKEFPQEIDAVAAAGFGLAEAGFNADGYGNDAQRKALGVSLDAARAKGLRLDVTMGPGWPLANADVAASTGLSQQELDDGRRDLVGPMTYSGPVPPVRPVDPCTAGSNPAQGCTGPAPAGKLIAVTAARGVREGNPAGQPPTQPTAVPAPGPAAVPPTLDPSPLVAPPAKVDPSGNVSWDVPAGHWILFAFYQRPSSQEVMDHLRSASATALTGFIDRNSLGDAASKLPGVGGGFFEDSIEISTPLLWTGDMATQFRARRGYDLTKFLPLLFIPGFYVVPVPQTTPPPEFDLPDGLADRVRHDFWETLDDLYVEHHFQPFEAWARTHGMHYRVQPAYAGTFHVARAARGAVEAGATVDHESRNAGDPQPYTDPTWHFAFDNYRELAGGAHQGGSSDMAIELGATNARDYMVALGEYKAIMDKAWAAGITRPIIHGLVYQPDGSGWPGASRFGGLIAESWNFRTFPEWRMWKPLTDYWARGNLVLRQGRPQVDVAIYRDAFTTWQASYADIGLDVLGDGLSPAFPGDPLHSPDGSRRVDNAAGATTPRPFFDTQKLEQAGFGLEYVDPLGLTAPRAGDGATLYPGGPSYRALVVDERALPAQTAAAIERHARAGLAVVFVGALPDRGTSGANVKAEDQAVRDAVRATLRAPHVARVAAQADVRRALDELGVEPGTAWSQPVPVYAQHRRTATTDYFYLWHAGEKAARFTATLKTRGTGRRLDLWSGDVEPLPLYTATGDSVRVPVSLAAGETEVLAFRRDRQAPHVTATDADDVRVAGPRAEIRDTQGGRRSVELSDGTRRVVDLPDLPAPLSPARWHLHVVESDPDGEVAKDLDLTTLADWRDISQLSGSSGAGRYTTTLNVSGDRIGADRGSYLELGRVESAAQVFLNGTRLTPAIVPPRRIDLGDRLKPGANELRVVVATTLKNRIAALAREGKAYGGAAAALPATQPYGLLGPVRLVPYGRASITLPRSSRPCTSRRRIAIHVRAPAGFRARTALVRVRGKLRRLPVRLVRHRLRVVVDLRPLPKGTAHVEIRIRGARRSVRTVRTYRLCTPRKERAGS